MPTPYTGEVVSISPTTSYGQQMIVISGRSKERTIGLAVPNAALRIVLQVGGFQRRITVATDGSGSFAYVFAPQSTDAGVYVVSLLHPEETGLPNQGQFTINRLAFAPTQINVNALRGVSQPFAVTAIASAGAGASGVQFQLNADEQPGGVLPAGISIGSTGNVNVPAGGSAQLNLSFTGNASAASTGSLVLSGYAAETGTLQRGSLVVNYRLSEPTPALYATPTVLETGVAQGQSVTETLTLENKGLVAATEVVVQVLNADGSSNVPGWLFLSSANQLGSIGVNQQQTVQVTAAPGASVTNGIYSFKLRLSSGNAAGGDIPLSVSVTQAGYGGVQFKVADIYTSTLDANGTPIPGLANATIKVQNAEVLTVQQSTTSNAAGTATLTNLPTGTYLYRASAPNHTDASGRFTIRPAVTTAQNVFLDFNAVTIEFSVVETVIQDRYDVNLTATFSAQVPAPVVLLEPLSINLPELQVGEEYTGELTLTNYGLVRADDVVFTLPSADAYYRIEVYGTLPTTLAAKQRLSLPYKITALQPLPGALPGTVSLRNVRPKALLAKDAAPACYNYRSGFNVSYNYACANGDTRSGTASSVINKAYGVCGGGGTTTYFGNTGGNGGGGFGGTGSGGWPTTPQAIPLTPQCAPGCDSCICKGPQPAGGPPAPPPPSCGNGYCLVPPDFLMKP